MGAVITLQKVREHRRAKQDLDVARLGFSYGVATVSDVEKRIERVEQCRLAIEAEQKAS